MRKKEIKKGKDGNDVDFDNYKYHEINEKTAKNKITPSFLTIT